MNIFKGFNFFFLFIFVFSIYLFICNFNYKQPPDTFIDLETHESIPLNQLKRSLPSNGYYVIWAEQTKTDRFVLISILLLLSFFGYKGTASIIKNDEKDYCGLYKSKKEKK